MKALRVLALCAGLAYLGWRVAFTWDGANLWLFGALIVAEAYGICRAHVELSLIGAPRPDRARSGHREAVSVDVVVLALDEPTSEIRAALLSAQAIKGRSSVVLADRDDRIELEELCRRLEVPRMVGGEAVDVGALLTEAISVGDSSLIVLVPGDVVVMPDVTEITGPCFDDPEVGVVVGRVETTNASREIDHDGYGAQHVRDVLIAPQLDADHALPWWNGFSVVRREALADVGGFAHGARGVTLPTGLRLQVGGWRMADSGEVVARRLAAFTDLRHVHRWSRDLRERLEVLRRPDVSWSSARITPRMRLAYWSVLIDATRGLQRLLLIFVLLATLGGVGLPLVAPGVLLLSVWSAQMGLRLVARWWATRPTGFRPWMLTDLRLLTTELVVTWKVLRRRPVDDLMDPAPGRRMRSVFLLGLQVALTAGLVAIGFGPRRLPYGDLATTALLAAALWLWFGALEARASLRLRQARRDYRASEQLHVLDGLHGVAVVGVSPFGVDVISDAPLLVGARVPLAFELPSADGGSGRFEAATVVRRVSKRGGRHTAYMRFAMISDDEMDRLIEYCAVVAGQREMRAPERHGSDGLVSVDNDALFAAIDESDAHESMVIGSGADEN